MPIDYSKWDNLECSSSESEDGNLDPRRQYEEQMRQQHQMAASSSSSPQPAPAVRSDSKLRKYSKPMCGFFNEHDEQYQLDFQFLMPPPELGLINTYDYLAIECPKALQFMLDNEYPLAHGRGGFEWEDTLALEALMAQPDFHVLMKLPDHHRYPTAFDAILDMPDDHQELLSLFTSHRTFRGEYINYIGNYSGMCRCAQPIVITDCMQVEKFRFLVDHPGCDVRTCYGDGNNMFDALGSGQFWSGDEDHLQFIEILFCRLEKDLQEERKMVPGDLPLELANKIASFAFSPLPNLEHEPVNANSVVATRLNEMKEKYFE